MFLYIICNLYLKIQQRYDSRSIIFYHGILLHYYGDSIHDVSFVVTNLTFFRESSYNSSLPQTGCCFTKAFRSWFGSQAGIVCTEKGALKL